MKIAFSVYIFLFLSFVYLNFNNVQAKDSSMAIVSVGEATLEKDKMVVQDPYYNDAKLSSVQKNVALEFAKLLRNDFSFYQKKFYLVEAQANNTQARPATQFDYWNSKGVRYLGTLSVQRVGDGIQIHVIFEDIKSKKTIYDRTHLVTLLNVRKIGHEAADEIYQKLIGKKSIFNSKIIFVSDRNSRGPKTIKEVYMMDFDGKNVNQLTAHGGIVMGPALSSDGRFLVYSLISYTSKNRNNDLYLMDLKTKSSHIISNQKGINSGAVFLTSGKSIALTLSVSGNAEIYEMNLETAQLRKITQHFAADVDPSITPDGSLMTFLSDRSGKAMIYTMDPRGTEVNVKRISFVGQFNATPRFSPDGKEIVFSSWLDNSFDLFRIASDGSGLVRLTKDFGSNEEPTYSNDGEFIAFTSQRVLSRTKIDQNIYIMDRDGEILGAITAQFGNCIAPRWSNF